MFVIIPTYCQFAKTGSVTTIGGGGQPEPIVSKNKERPGHPGQGDTGGGQGEDPQIQQQIQTIHQLLRSASGFNKKVLEFDYSDDEGDGEGGEAVQPTAAMLEALQSLISNEAQLEQLKAYGGINSHQIAQLKQLLPGAQLNLNQQQDNSSVFNQSGLQQPDHSLSSMLEQQQQQQQQQQQVPPPFGNNAGGLLGGFPGGQMGVNPGAIWGQPMQAPPSGPTVIDINEMTGGDSGGDIADSAGGVDDDIAIIDSTYSPRSPRNDRDRNSDRDRKRGSSSRRSRSRSRSRDRGRGDRSSNRKGDSRRRSRSRSYERRSSRRRSRSRSPRESREAEREKRREREKKGLPAIKKGHLSVCSTTIWVGHLSKLVTNEDLSDTFGQYGEILTINMIPPRGCAFICMNRRMDASKALDKLHKKHVQGKPMTVSVSVLQLLQIKTVLLA